VGVSAETFAGNVPAETSLFIGSATEFAVRALIQRPPRRRERLHKHGAYLRRQPSAHDDHALFIS